MSLDARFTQLRRSVDRGRPGVSEIYQRHPSPRERISSLKNRILAMEMAERPNVMAALSRGRARVRRGSFNSGSLVPMQRSRSPFPRRSRSRQRSGSLRRSNSLGRLNRSQSVQSLMSLGSDDGFGMMNRRRRGGGFRTRVFTRGSRVTARGGIQKLNMDLVASSRRRRSASLSRLGNSLGGGGFRRGGRGGRDINNAGNSIKARLGLKSASLTRSASASSLNARGRGRLRSRGAGGGRGRGAFRQRGGSGNTARGGAMRSPGRGRGGFINNTSRGQGRGRGQGAGNRGRRGVGGMRGRSIRGRRGGRGGNRKPTVPTKEELDSELDKYMSNTKSYLDKQLDQYMATPEATA